MVDACKAQGVAEPDYEESGGFVRIVFHRTTGKTTMSEESVNGGINGGINDSLKKTLEYIRQHEGYNTRQISVGLDVSFDTIDKHIRVLVKKGFIEHRGSKKTGGYYPVGTK